MTSRQDYKIKLYNEEHRRKVLLLTSLMPFLMPFFSFLLFYIICTHLLAPSLCLGAGPRQEDDDTTREPQYLGSFLPPAKIKGKSSNVVFRGCLHRAHHFAPNWVTVLKCRPDKHSCLVMPLSVKMSNAVLNGFQGLLFSSGVTSLCLFHELRSGLAYFVSLFLLNRARTWLFQGRPIENVPRKPPRKKKAFGYHGDAS